mmetsp:Transcript_19068/g.43156  ORF Transcript_19068/g.43156 Transcript_19068/m.43156 type:complete len:250 (+) Transcript_19068:983-1732(+)
MRKNTQEQLARKEESVNRCNHEEHAAAINSWILCCGFHLHCDEDRVGQNDHREEGFKPAGGHNFLKKTAATARIAFLCLTSRRAVTSRLEHLLALLGGVAHEGGGVRHLFRVRAAFLHVHVQVIQVRGDGSPPSRQLSRPHAHRDRLVTRLAIACAGGAAGRMLLAASLWRHRGRWGRTLHQVFETPHPLLELRFQVLVELGIPPGQDRVEVIRAEPSRRRKAGLLRLREQRRWKQRPHGLWRRLKGSQ